MFDIEYMGMQVGNPLFTFLSNTGVAQGILNVRVISIVHDDKIRLFDIAEKVTSWIAHVRGKFEQLRPALRRNQYPRTTNQTERFFRAFQRFYTTRGGFHSVISAQRELMLFVVAYVFTRQADSGQAPIEQIVPQAKDMPFYQIINAPFQHGLANMCMPEMRGGTNLAAG